MVTGGVAGMGDPHRRGAGGPGLTFDLAAVRDAPGQVALGAAKSVVNGVSDTAETALKGLGAAGVLAPSWASVQAAEALGMNGLAARNRAVLERATEAVAGIDLPATAPEGDAEETGAVIGILGSLAAGGAGLLRGLVRGARREAAPVMETLPTPSPPSRTVPPPAIRMGPDIDAHIQGRDMTVPRRSGIGGAHAADAFEAALRSERALVVSRTPHPTVRGVERVRYRMPSLDRNGVPDGGHKLAVRPKTVYDPRVIPHDTMARWGREAAADAAQRSGGILPREWTGTTSEGIEMRGHADLQTNQVTTFYVEMPRG